MSAVYVSSRGQAPSLDFADVLLAGLAEDGGLYVPRTWPKMTADDMRALRGLTYAEAALRVTRPFVAGAICEDDYAGILVDAYRDFCHPAVAPLVQLDTDIWLMELFHGPTLAFKDYALQVVGRLFDYVLTRRERRATILGATSGDTGSAAIAACAGCQALDIVILHPHGRCSEIQRRQMTTVRASNVYNVAIEGNFDDCQSIVKSLFADQELRHSLSLAAINSINWARIMLQIVYFAWAAVCLGAPARSVGFAVPTGNFGNVYAGYCARKMGFPISELIVASNANDSLTRYFESGEMRTGDLCPTLSPSMDIQISSNFERLVYDLLKGDAERVSVMMDRFRRDGHIRLGKTVWERSLNVFGGFRADDHQTLAVIAEIYDKTGYILDPHTAIGVGAAQSRRCDAPLVALATAHSAKFPDAIEQALGHKPQTPTRLGEAIAGDERFVRLPADTLAVRDYMRGILL